MFRCAQCGALNRVGAARQGAPVCGRCKNALDVSGAPQEVDAAALDRAIASSPVPVVVDFWAAWCGPCKFAGPVLDRYARDRPGRLIVLKLNTDDHPAPSQRAGIRGIPTFIVYANGAEIARRSGAMPIDALAQWLDPLLAQPASGTAPAP